MLRLAIVLFRLPIRLHSVSSFLHTGAVLILLSQPVARAAPSAGSGVPESNRVMAAGLAELVRVVDPLQSTLLTADAIQILRTRLEQASSLPEQLTLRFNYGVLLLNDGQSEAALEQLLMCERLIASNGLTMPAELRPKFLEIKALCYLRIGEQENCLRNHNGDSCLWPIRGGGVHVSPRGSRGAIEVLQEWLELTPAPAAVWLLNLAYMTLGEYPDGVPVRWLLPPELFAAEHAVPRFHDVAGAAGVAVDDLAGGVVLEDFDHDGYLDLMVSGMGYTSQLRYFRNRGDGTFHEATEAAWLSGLTSGLNLVSGDYNNDGWMDVLVLRGGWQENNGGQFPNSLLRNNGDGTFTDVTEEAGLLSFHPTQTATWFDFDGDGWLDVFIGNESLTAKGESHPCELYRNNGDGTFTECAAEAGLAVVDYIKAVASGDFNNDGRSDLYLSSREGPNRLFRNDGKRSRGGGVFTDVTAEAGVDEPGRSFPCWFWDYDNDGWLDLFVTGYAIRDVGDIALDVTGQPHPGERARLYRNQGNGTFRDVTQETGLFRVLHAMGSNFGDFDYDGWLDFYLGTGDPYLGMLIPNRMFRNDAGRRFQDVTTAGGFGQLQKGHAIAFGDINNDGAQDIYSVIGGAYPGDHYPNQLFANPGHDHRWVMLSFEGRRTNRLGFGARVRVVANGPDGERHVHRVVGTGGSFGAAASRQEIGLGTATTIDRIEVTWPATGETQVVRGLSPGKHYRIQEGTMDAVEVPLPTFPWPRPASTEQRAHHHH